MLHNIIQLTYTLGITVDPHSTVSESESVQTQFLVFLQCESTLDGQRGKCWCVTSWNGKKIVGSSELPTDAECPQEFNHWSHNYTHIQALRNSSSHGLFPHTHIPTEHYATDFFSIFYLFIVAYMFFFLKIYIQVHCFKWVNNSSLNPPKKKNFFFLLLKGFCINMFIFT